MAPFIGWAWFLTLALVIAATEWGTTEGTGRWL
jgi:hypothetical protein